MKKTCLTMVLLASLVGCTANATDGEDGMDGKNGATGQQGPAGKDGQDGEDGAPGPKGDKGDRGAPGLNGGADGKDGAQGPQGIQGPMGPAGVNGAKGDPGTPGSNGVTIYRTVDCSGIVGTGAPAFSTNWSFTTVIFSTGASMSVGTMNKGGAVASSSALGPVLIFNGAGSTVIDGWSLNYSSVSNQMVIKDNFGQIADTKPCS